MNGIPTIAPTTVTVSTTPTIRNTRPRLTATNRLVAATMPATSFQMAQNGHRYQGIFLLMHICYLCLHRMFTHHSRKSCRIIAYSHDGGKDNGGIGRAKAT